MQINLAVRCWKRSLWRFDSKYMSATSGSGSVQAPPLGLGRLSVAVMHIEVLSTDWPLGAGQDKCGREDGTDSLRTQPNTV